MKFDIIIIRRACIKNEPAFAPRCNIAAKIEGGILVASNQSKMKRLHGA